MERLICLVIGYVCGLLQTGYLVGRMNHIDIRKEGSGNAGSTNAVRVMGWKAGAITFAGDVLKCVAAVVIARVLFKDSECVPLLAMYAGMGATLGHNFPFYLKFKGGKGIATTTGVLLVILPLQTVIIFSTCVFIVYLTKIMSIGSLIGLVASAVVPFIMFPGNTPLHITVVIIALLGIWSHRENIKRLSENRENKLHISKKSKT